MQNQKRKVLIVVHQLTYGGVQKSLIPALNAIDYEKNEVTLYVRKNRLQLLSEINNNVTNLIVNEDKTKYYRKPYMIWLMICEALLALLNKDKALIIKSKMNAYLNRKQMEYEKEHYFNKNQEYDVIISYIQGYTALFVAEYLEGAKKILFYHGSIDDQHDFHERIIQKFDKVVGVNLLVQEMLGQAYPTEKDKLIFIDNYVGAEEIRNKAQEFELDRGKEVVVLATCGRFSNEKGFNLAVETSKILKDKGLSFKWYFIGDGAERGYLENLIKEYELEDQIEITGVQANPYPYIEGCDIYVQPSYEESYGLTIAEAKILNKPIVSTKTVGGSYQIQNRENGLLVGISAAEIAEGIETYLKDEELRKTIIDNLKRIDYSEVEKEYRLRWKELLED